MYKILFIDEEQDTLDDFLDYIENSSQKGNIIPIVQLPLGNLEEMIDCIINTNPDAIITDFKLNDSRESINYNVPYNGTELVQAFQCLRESFPCFVMTAFDDLAISESEDVNIVYIKNILYSSEKESNARAQFLDRVICQINHYKSKLDEAEKELLELLELRKSGKATIKDEEKLINLDRFLENSIDKRSSIPEEFKTLSNSEKLSDLIYKVDKLIDEIGEDANEL